MKKLFKTQHDRIPIDPPILAAIGHRFIAKTKRKLNMPKRGSEATCAETRNRRLFDIIQYGLRVHRYCYCPKILKVDKLNLVVCHLPVTGEEMSLIHQK